ncbi:MAG: hypothetical protein ACRC2V_25815, partial [Xenococcaceae cyanobacterium]
MKEKMWKESQELNELRCDSKLSTELEEHELEAISGGRIYSENPAYKYTYEGHPPGGGNAHSRRKRLSKAARN